MAIKQLTGEAIRKELHGVDHFLDAAAFFVTMVFCGIQRLDNIFGQQVFSAGFPALYRRGQNGLFEQCTVLTSKSFFFRFDTTRHHNLGNNQKLAQQIALNLFRLVFNIGGVDIVGLLKIDHCNVFRFNDIAVAVHQLQRGLKRCERGRHTGRQCNIDSAKALLLKQLRQETKAITRFHDHEPWAVDGHDEHLQIHERG